MKEKFNFLALSVVVLVATLGFVSCSDDDDDTNNKSIVGTWVFRSVTADVKTNSATNDAIIEQDLIEGEEADFNGDTITFYADGTAVYASGYSFNYTYSNGKLLSKYGEGEDDWSENDVTITDTTFTLHFDYTEDYEVLSDYDVARLEIENPSEYKLTKAIANINYVRIK